MSLTTNNHNATLLQSTEATYQGITSDRELVLFVFIIYMLVGIPGNILIICSVVLIKKLRTTNNIFVLNLAVADLLIIGYILPFSFVDVANGQYPTLGLGCQVNGVMVLVLFATSLLTIIVIAVNRYVAISHFRTRVPEKIFTVRNSIIICVAIWCSAGVCAICPIFLGIGIIYDHTIHMCLFDRYASLLYSIVVVMLTIVIPTIATSILYCVIYNRVKKSRKNFMENSRAVFRRRFENEMNILKAQFVVFLLFSVLCIPFGVIALFVGRSKTAKIHSIVTFLSFANSCVNAIAYGAFNANFRKAYLDIVQCNPRRTQIQVITLTENRTEDRNNSSMIILK